MPRGENPNSRANLKPLEKGLPKKAQREVQRKGTKAGNEAKKQYASLTEALKDQCTSEMMQQLTDMLIKRAKAGNLKAYELIRDQMGEKPIEKVQVATVDNATVNELKDALSQRSELDEFRETGSNKPIT